MTEQAASEPSREKSTPIVLALSGHDPTGGAGVQADIEAISAQGCYATSAITCLTVQDTSNVHRLEPVSADLLLAQASALLADLPVSVIKVGLIGNATNAAVIAGLLADWPRIPVVLDPVLSAGGGADLSGDRLIQVMCEQLLQLTTLLTPNRAEARRLSGVDAAAGLVEAEESGPVHLGEALAPARARRPLHLEGIAA